MTFSIMDGIQCNKIQQIMFNITMLSIIAFSEKLCKMTFDMMALSIWAFSVK
jgi:hypothetical protein